MDFSIVIPTFNRPVPLGRCLDSIKGINYPDSQFEIIVVDDGSTLSYQEVIAHHPDVHWVRVENGGPARARNQGAEAAQGHWLCFIDDDCYPDPEWLNNLRSEFEMESDILVGGSTPAFPGASTYDQVSQFITHLVYMHYNQDPRQSRFFASNNLAVSKNLFQEVGGFDCRHTKNAAEDRTLCNIVEGRGRRLLWNKNAVVYHHPQLTFSKFAKMYFRYGRGAYTYHRTRQSGRMMKDMSFHASLYKLISRGLKEHPDLPLLPTLGLLGVWQLSNLAGFLWQTIQGQEF